MDGCLVCEDLLTCDECVFGYKSNNKEVCTFDFLMVGVITLLVVSATIVSTILAFTVWKAILRKLKSKNRALVESPTTDPVKSELKDDFEKSYQNVLISEDVENISE